MKSNEYITVITRYERGGVVAYSVDDGETYWPSTQAAIENLERQIIKKKISKKVQQYIAGKEYLIRTARHKVLEAGGNPDVMYIGDIFEFRGHSIIASPMKLDTECKIFGLKIIADYRVPKNEFYIMQGEL